MAARLSSRSVKAFDVAPESGIVFEFSSFVSAYLDLMRGIERRDALMLLLGPAGGGKTTLLRTMQGSLTRKRGLVLFRSRPEDGLEDLLGSLLDELRITPSSPDREDRLEALSEFLSRRLAPSVLLVDEAHRVPDRTLVGLAAIAIYGQGEAESLQVVLAGERQLEQRLNRPELAWITDHIATTVHLDSLAADEIGEYVAYRLAGSRRPLLPSRRPHNPFVPEALSRVLLYSSGVPGTVNRLCRHALVGRSARVSAAQVDRAAFECGLTAVPPLNEAMEVGSGSTTGWASAGDGRGVAPTTEPGDRRRYARAGYGATAFIAAAGLATAFVFQPNLPEELISRLVPVALGPVPLEQNASRADDLRAASLETDAVQTAPPTPAAAEPGRHEPPVQSGAPSDLANRAGVSSEDEMREARAHSAEMAPEVPATHSLADQTEAAVSRAEAGAPIASAEEEPAPDGASLAALLIEPDLPGIDTQTDLALESVGAMLDAHAPAPEAPVSPLALMPASEMQTAIPDQAPDPLPMPESTSMDPALAPAPVEAEPKPIDAAHVGTESAPPADASSIEDEPLVEEESPVTLALQVEPAAEAEPGVQTQAAEDETVAAPDSVNETPPQPDASVPPVAARAEASGAILGAEGEPVQPKPSEARDSVHAVAPQAPVDVAGNQALDSRDMAPDARSSPPEMPSLPPVRAEAAMAQSGPDAKERPENGDLGAAPAEPPPEATAESVSAAPAVVAPQAPVVDVAQAAAPPSGQSGPRVVVPPPRRLDPERLLARGHALLQQGDPVGARLFFERAAAQGHAGAMGAVGSTFDPLELRRLGVFGVAGEPQRALEWYRRAAAANDRDSRERIARLEDWMARRR